MRANQFISEIPNDIEVDGIKRPTTNSNGQPIHPKIEGIVNFWNWFGDSKVVDKSGRPLVVYHATNTSFDSFDAKHLDTNVGQSGGAFWFAEHPDSTSRYGKFIMPCYATLDDIFVVNADTVWNLYHVSEKPPLFMMNGKPMVRGDDYEFGGKGVKEVLTSGDGVLVIEPRLRAKAMNFAKRNHYQAVKFESIYDGEDFPDTVYAVLDTSLVKSTIGNKGTFDTSSSVISETVQMSVNVARIKTIVTTSLVNCLVKELAAGGNAKKHPRVVSDHVSRGVTLSCGFDIFQALRRAKIAPDTLNMISVNDNDNLGEYNAQTGVITISTTAFAEATNVIRKFVYSMIMQHGITGLTKLSEDELNSLRYALAPTVAYASDIIAHELTHAVHRSKQPLTTRLGGRSHLDAKYGEFLDLARMRYTGELLTPEMQKRYELLYKSALTEVGAYSTTWASEIATHFGFDDPNARLPSRLSLSNAVAHYVGQVASEFRTGDENMQKVYRRYLRDTYKQVMHHYDSVMERRRK